MKAVLLTEWTLNYEDGWDLQSLADAVLVLSRYSEVVSSTLNQVGNTAGGTRDR